MSDLFLGVAALLLVILLMAPTTTFLLVGWTHRRQEILSGISSKEDKAIKKYFSGFQPSFASCEPDCQKRFGLYYNAHFGRHHFFPPTVLLLVIAGSLLYLCRHILGDAFSKGQDIMKGQDAITLFAVMGAYLWVVYDQIKKWWYSSLSPKDLYEACFRFALAIPFGYAVSLLAAEDAGPIMAFFMGAFPMQTLLSIFRKIWSDNAGIKGPQEGAKSELIKLQGIDASKVERLEAEGITTICQLAYTDPIKLTIRTNMGYSYLIDCISQALLHLYTNKDHEKWQKLGLRGGFEITNLMNGLEHGTARDKAEAGEIVCELARSVGVSEAAIKNILWEVGNDPYMQFIYLSWTSGE